MKKRVIPYRTIGDVLEEIDNSLNWPDHKVTGFSITVRSDHGQRNLRFGKTAFGPKSKGKVILREIDSIPECDREKALAGKLYEESDGDI